MANSKMRALIVVVISLLLSIVLIFSQPISELPSSMASTFAICVALAFGIQWLVFVPSYLKQTEKYYDLTGSLTYISLVFLAISQLIWVSPAAFLMAFMVACWAARLGSFLFLRVCKTGSDSRFEQIKPDKYRFFAAWTLQGLWVVITASPALMVLTSPQHSTTPILTWIGFAIWLSGFLFEVIADSQKYTFKQDPANQDKFICSGLWRYSRHPNYFGEIVLWFGVAVAAFPLLQGWQHVALISPFFVTLLLTKVSGIPLLEEKADKRWGDNAQYQQYKENTSVLIPKP